MNGILNYSFLKIEIKGLYELTILMNIRYYLKTNEYSRIFAMIHSNLGLHELSYVSLHPKNNCPEQVF